jgi:hypothetical protein
LFGITGQAPARKRPVTTSTTVVKIESSQKASLPVRHNSQVRAVKDLIATMPSYIRAPYRAYSYPVCIDSVEDDYADNLPDIDEDPFAHFITPINEDEDPWDMSLGAGIEVPEGYRSSKASKFKSNVADKWARYVKHSHTQLHTQYHEPTILEEEEEEEEESFMGLDDARLNERPSPVRHLTPPKITVTEPSRGRAQELVARKAQNQSRRRYSRTLSGHSHSWREPSPDLFTVDESEEDELPVLRRSRTRKAKDGAERRRSSTRSQSRLRSDSVVEKARL